MRIIVPIYITQQRTQKQNDAVMASVLFHPTMSVHGVDLPRVMNKLTLRLREHLSRLARKPLHNELLRWHEDREVAASNLKLNLELRDTFLTIRLTLVTLENPYDPRQRKLVFSPQLPDLWFDLNRGEDLAVRATEVYQSHFERIHRESPDVPLGRYSLEGKAWVDAISIDHTASQKPSKPIDPLRAFMGGDDVSDGAEELSKVGRCLSWLDASQLADPSGVDPDLDRLQTLLQLPDRPCIALVGPRGSGKTARIEGAVLRTIREPRRKSKRQVWHLSPARLISGMSYLGQWQQRVLAILNHAYRHDHTLVIDNFLGLFEAGKTRDSSMCVADLLRGQIHSRPVRLVTEMTSEAWSTLRRRDPGLADRFTVIRTEAVDRNLALSIMTRVRRKLETEHGCQFDIDSLPQIISFYDRFERESVLPGKAVAAMHRLAVTHARQSIGYREVLCEYHKRSGIAESLLDDNEVTTEAHTVEQIRKFVVGQDQPVKRLSETVLVASTRLSDRSRPLGVYLLVGPTGVGKTQLAKAIAQCMFDEGGLIRLDMNELSSPWAATRLIGTPGHPDGILTSAVARRPNAVLLLDEIEKAHPAVLDVLLPALGEARLSDAQGRTVDLSGLVVLMTSNLGTRQSGRGVGFAADDRQAIAATHLKAVKQFFRPEFFNRIDGVLHFDPLSTETIVDIAKIQFNEILMRDGLQRRGVMIDCDDEVIEATARRGFDPLMGARALKRRIERELVRPASESLAADTGSEPVLLGLRFDDRRQLKVECETIRTLPPRSPSVTASSPTLAETVTWAANIVESVLAQTDDRPIQYDTAVGADTTSLTTIALRDGVAQCQQLIAEAQVYLEVERLARPNATPIHTPRGVAIESWSKSDSNPQKRRQDVKAYEDVRNYLDETLVDADPSMILRLRDELIDETARLRARHHDTSASTAMLMRVRQLGRKGLSSDGGSDLRPAILIAMGINEWLMRVEDLTVQAIDVNWNFLVTGLFCKPALDEVVGTWREVGLRQMSITQVDALPVGFPVDDFENHPKNATCQRLIQLSKTPFATRLSPIRRICYPNQSLEDRATGLQVTGKGYRRKLRELLAMSRRML